MFLFGQNVKNMTALFLLLIACAVLKEAGAEEVPLEDEPATEEQLQKLEEMKYVLVCKGCEDMVEAAEKMMAKKISKKLKSATREVQAIEIIEQVCKNATFGAEDILRCENAVDILDGDDELTNYLKNGVYDKDYKDKACKSFCKWKTDISDQISSMQENMIEKVRNEELEKRKLQYRSELLDKHNNMTLFDKVQAELAYIWEDLADWWLVILLSSVGTFFFMIFVQVCLDRGGDKG